MAGTSKIARLCIVGNRRLNSLCPVRGTDTRPYSFGGIDTDGKSRAETCRIINGLRIQAKRIAFLASRTNTMLSLPMLMSMVGAHHGFFM